MGFWNKSFEVFQDVTSFGGTYVVRERTARFESLRTIYQEVRNQLSDGNSKLISLVGKLERQVSRSDAHLRQAERMLNPLRRSVISDKSSSSMRRPSIPFLSREQLQRLSSSNIILDPLAPIVAGTVAGAATSVGAWGVVQLVGHASTGTAMAGLHGAAAANAGWAWFGGGSLAVHGGGMALGHVLLPGIGTAIAVGVSSAIAYREAGRLGTLCEEFEKANTKNAISLQKLRVDLTSVERLKTKLEDEDDVLERIIAQVRERLFKLGYLSHLWRLIRFWFRGYYYAPAEFMWIERLDSAVLKFVSTFNKV